MSSSLVAKLLGVVPGADTELNVLDDLRHFMLDKFEFESQRSFSVTSN